ncbi:hypothetical protein [Hominenteromicrobium sp.]|uniref:hypothetical protein n=1 Tax=Hominenteromicrobium sp. TaxID=3073581 RepID=UPI003AB15793
MQSKMRVPLLSSADRKTCADDRIKKIGEMMQSGTKEHELLKDGSFRHRLVQNFFREYVENRFST